MVERLIFLFQNAVYVLRAVKQAYNIDSACRRDVEHQVVAEVWHNPHPQAGQTWISHLAGRSRVRHKADFVQSICNGRAKTRCCFGCSLFFQIGRAVFNIGQGAGTNNHLTLRYVVTAHRLLPASRFALYFASTRAHISCKS